MALFRPIGKQYHCGASIVNDRFLVSAAHCDSSTPMDITVGTDTAESGGQRYDIEKVVVHPLYKLYDYDVCVIKIKGTFRFSDRVSPIQMAQPNAEPSNGVMLLTTGFGDTMDNQNIDSLRATSNQLLGVKVPLVDREVCRKTLTMFEITERMLCAGGQRGKDSCKGDSGGPLVEKEGNVYKLVGIVSFGFSCATQLPGVYTNVAALRTFIDEVIQKNS
ncbi:trypsin 5G1-like isoform X2 [Pararge aegeria]|nr:trypsin 5G1-like isoform X2 [Pararge aegeria]